ncbi:uncharacterized protein PHALS_14033 [Plasmopara halstedii]|uniref:Uncharacterized protein n=1 Tax=Plasmopara halstedii TaxID=4781 RepID=A0A0P1AQW8_PLAHL|nr:uncharacterized protein PHALS_14033 [Plasmopara halstedii]CEG43740.1 hypothetical protein PHALS_14033 [Plasmopara halstedii]|eukprot:XP_024580109.1 hypothetical protein PHALS_14033 [Plasmopara halstedii]
MEFALAETPEKLLNLLSSYRSSNFDRITLCGVFETVPELQRTRFLRTLKRIQHVSGTTLLEFNACTAAHMATHAWTNNETGFTLQETLGYSDHYERTFLEWNRQFQARWGPHIIASRVLQTHVGVLSAALGCLLPIWCTSSLSNQNELI